MNEKDNFWITLNDLLNTGITGYSAYKGTTWVDKLISFLPFVFLLIFLYLLIKGKS